MVSSPITPANNKIAYIDWLRVLLVFLVVLFHCLGAYTPSGDVWYEHEPAKSPWLVGPMSLAIVMLMVFFMGLYFGISAYFIQSSYEKKGPGKFTLDRLLRLGIPTAFYSVVMSPIMMFFMQRQHIRPRYRFADYLSHLTLYDFGFGVTWFIAALLLFTLLYVLLRVLSNRRLPTWPSPGIGKVLIIGLILGLITFTIRMFYPTTKVQLPTFFHFAFFGQYTAMFVFGLIARKNNWLTQLNNEASKKAGWVALALAVLILPVILAIGAAAKIPGAHYLGGLNWMSFTISIWNEVIGICISFWLLGFASRRWNRESALINKLTRRSFAVYVFHPVLIVALTIGLRHWAIDPGFKLFVVLPIVLLISFLWANLIVRIPVINKIF